MDFVQRDSEVQRPRPNETGMPQANNTPITEGVRVYKKKGRRKEYIREYKREYLKNPVNREASRKSALNYYHKNAARLNKEKYAREKTQRLNPLASENVPSKQPD